MGPRPRQRTRTEEQKGSPAAGGGGEVIPDELHAKARRLAGTLLRPRAEAEGPQNRGSQDGVRLLLGGIGSKGF